MYDPIVSRSSHKEKATRSGGMALFFTFCVCYGLGKGVYSMSIDLYALIAFIFIALTGLADDLFSIKYREKFFLQVFAAIVLLQSEIYIDSFEIIQISKEYPITPKEHGTDFLMNNRHLWLRSKKQYAILKIRHEIVRSIRNFFDDNDFTLIDTPIFTPNAIGKALP